MKVIDFHTHTFEDFIAKRAIDKLRRSANIINYTDGTDEALSTSSIDNNVELSVVLPIATKIMQANEINSRSVKKNRLYKDTRRYYFAAIHPEDSNIPAMLSGIKGAGFKGIKLHPVFQDSYIDDDCYLKLIDMASELDLITVIHAGEDISYPGNDWAHVRNIINMIDTVKPRNLVLAHMGGWNQWDIVESDLAGAEVYFDTSFCLNKRIVFDKSKPESDVMLSKEQFCRLVRLHGDDKILFGSDSPWTSQGQSVEDIMDTGLEKESLEKIFANNAMRILGL